MTATRFLLARACGSCTLQLSQDQVSRESCMIQLVFQVGVGREVVDVAQAAEDRARL
jgi:hypothetical protein